MRRLTLGSAAISLVAISISIFTARVFASPLRSLIRAATSNNGQFLVVATLKLGLAGEGGGQAILGETFEVCQRETFINRDRFTTPNKYYSFDDWKIELPRQNEFIAPWPIISDDGSTLILVGVSPPVSRMTLLAIYKRHGSEGQLVRSYTVDDLWDLKPGEERIDGYFDSTPEWFADGKFSFSDDGEMLLYADKDHAVQISLKDGTVTKRK